MTDKELLAMIEVEEAIANEAAQLGRPKPGSEYYWIFQSCQQARIAALRKMAEDKA